MRNESRALNGDINVTPFLDVLLVLIITFMAAMTARKAMDAQLPVKCSGTCVATDDSIVLEVLDDGSYQQGSRREGRLAATNRFVRRA